LTFLKTAKSKISPYFLTILGFGGSFLFLLPFIIYYTGHIKKAPIFNWQKIKQYEFIILIILITGYVVRNIFNMTFPFILELLVLLFMVIWLNR